MTLRVTEIFKILLMYIFNVSNLWVLDFVPPQNLSH